MVPRDTVKRPRHVEISTSQKNIGMCVYIYIHTVYTVYKHSYKRFSAILMGLSRSSSRGARIADVVFGVGSG